MALSNEELLSIRDATIDSYRDCRLHIANIEVSLDKMIKQRQDVITNLNDTLFSITKEIDKVKKSKAELFQLEIELELKIKNLNQLIAERRLETG